MPHGVDSNNITFMADITLRLLTVSFVDGSTVTCTADRLYQNNSSNRDLISQYSIVESKTGCHDIQFYLIMTHFTNTLHAVNSTTFVVYLTYFGRQFLHITN
jgi:hypothetical protein